MEKLESLRYWQTAAVILLHVQIPFRNMHRGSLYDSRLVILCRSDAPQKAPSTLW